MSVSKKLFQSFAALGVAAYLLASCGGSDGHPTNLTGTGATGGSGGSGGTGATGGTGGKVDAGGDATADSSSDATPDTSTDATQDVTQDVSDDAMDAADDASDGDAEIDSAYCSDGSKDGDETDQDCGGAVCSPCAEGKVCAVDSDCQDKKCGSSKTCSPPLCTDAVQNGNETDVDCGGKNCPKCADTKACSAAEDCVSGVCAGTPKTCQVPTCLDTVKNGNETDIDCGGACPPCALGQACGGPADCTSKVCTTNQCKCPGGMVLAPATGGGAYCVDQYEVTNEQYELFYTANPNFALPSECSWNTGAAKFTPGAAWPAANQTEKATPVRGVDWCDAWAYCKWAGKRLCGKQGTGPVAFNEYADASKGQWQNACSGGINAYPYSSTYNSLKCIGSDNGSAPLPGTRSTQSCVGTAPNLYDMSGNVAEWEDSCNGTTGASDNCRVRGGSYKEQQTAIACAADRAIARNSQLEDVGFRCCFP